MFIQAPSKCPVCERNSDGDEFKFIQDYENEDGKFSLYQCSKCLVQFWMPFKNPGAKWYENWYQDRSSQNQTRKKISLTSAQRKFLKLFGKNLKGKTVLDIGCGTGEFLNACHERGADVWGCDFDGNAIESAKKKFGLKNVYAVSFQDFLKTDNLPKFDFITFFEVIEHIDDHPDFFARILNISKPESIIGLSTPSRNRILVSNLIQDFPPHHLTRYNPKSLENIFLTNGFKKIYIKPVDGLYYVFASLMYYPKGLIFKSIKRVDKTESDKKTEQYQRWIFARKVAGSIKKIPGLYKVIDVLRFIVFPVWLIAKIFGYEDGDLVAFFIREK